MTSPFVGNCLKGQVAVITGGGSGIGLGIARQLVAHGCAVLLVGRRPKVLQAAQRSLSGSRVLVHVCDVRQYEQCQQVIRYCQQHFQRLDILINGAAGNFLAVAKDLSPKGFQTVLAIDLLGTFHMCRAAYDLLQQTSTTTSTTSVVVNISATLQYGATWWQSHASAAKAAVDSLTRSLALEWAPRIRVVGIAPGPIADTPGTRKLSAGRNNIDIPLNRMGTVHDIGQAVLYLATASFVTGTVLVVDGGHWLYTPPWVPQEQVSTLSRKMEGRKSNL